MITLKAEDFNEMYLKLSVIRAAINAVKCSTDHTDEISLDGASINTLMYVASDHLEEVRAILDATPSQPNEIMPDDLKETLENIATDEERSLADLIIFFLKRTVALKRAVAEYGEKINT